MKKIIVSIVAVAVMSLAAGCGNSDGAQSQSTTAKSSAVQSQTADAAKSSAAQSQVTNAAKRTSPDNAEVATFSDFTAGSFTFSNISIKYGGTVISTYTFTMTYNGPGEIYVNRVEFNNYTQSDLSTVMGVDIKKTLVSGKSVEVSFDSSGDYRITNKIEFKGVNSDPKKECVIV